VVYAASRSTTLLPDTGHMFILYSRCLIPTGSIIWNKTLQTVANRQRRMKQLARLNKKLSALSSHIPHTHTFLQTHLTINNPDQPQPPISHHHLLHHHLLHHPTGPNNKLPLTPLTTPTNASTQHLQHLHRPSPPRRGFPPMVASLLCILCRRHVNLLHCQRHPARHHDIRRTSSRIFHTVALRSGLVLGEAAYDQPAEGLRSAW
jgi:hypothetical protein